MMKLRRLSRRRLRLDLGVLSLQPDGGISHPLLDRLSSRSVLHRSHQQRSSGERADADPIRQSVRNTLLCN
jgi:hypothetical protein